MRNGTLEINLNGAEREQLIALAARLRGGENISSLVQSYDPWRFGRNRITRAFAHPRVVGKMGGPATNLLGNKAAQLWQHQGRSAFPHIFAQPDQRDVHIDTAMTQVAISYYNANYIGASVFPRVQVVHKSDDYFIFDKGDGTSKAMFRDEAQIRPLSTAAVEVGYDITSAGNSCKERAAQHPIDDRIRQNADAAIMPDMRASRMVTDKIDLSLERIIAGIVFLANSWTNDVVVGATDQWDAATSDPLTQWANARIAISGRIGQDPNTLVLGYEVYEKVCLHPLLIDRIKYTGTEERPAMVTPSMLAALAGVDRVLIGKAIYETAAEGLASSLARIWGKYAWMGYVSPAPALDEPSAGYVFSTGRIIDRFRNDEITSDILRGREEYDVKQTWADSGYLWEQVIS